MLSDFRDEMTEAVLEMPAWNRSVFAAGLVEWLLPLYERLAPGRTDVRHALKLVWGAVAGKEITERTGVAAIERFHPKLVEEPTLESRFLEQVHGAALDMLHAPGDDSGLHAGIAAWETLYALSLLEYRRTDDPDQLEPTEVLMGDDHDGSPEMMKRAEEIRALMREVKGVKKPELPTEWVERQREKGRKILAEF
jgi:hypothetical protein